MTIICLGRVIKQNNEHIQLQDYTTKQLVEGWLVEGSLPVSVGTEGIFVGKYAGDKFLIKKVHEKKFLAPLYEEELIKIGSILNLQNEIKGPFDEWLDKLKSNI